MTFSAGVKGGQFIEVSSQGVYDCGAAIESSLAAGLIEGRR
jgi:hypothetical protein